MPASVQQLYRILEIPVGAGKEDLKIAHRKLVKKWHPDQFQDKQQRVFAEKKLSQINNAYSQLLQVKNSRKSLKKSQHTTFYQKPSGESQTNGNRQRKTTRSQSTTKKKRPRSQNKKRSHGKNVFKQSWFERFLSEMNNRFQLAHLQRRKKKLQFTYKREVEKNERRWIKKRNAFDERTRIGLYRSFINSVIFGHVGLFRNDEETTALGSFSLNDKYELELRHNLIQDKIFYAVNGGINLGLKYIFGFILFFQFILNIINHYYLGGSGAAFSSLLNSQIIMIGLFGLLILPDNFFQRYLLWKNRNLSLSEIEETFKQNTLPKPWNKAKYGILTTKYLLLLIILL